MRNIYCILFLLLVPTFSFGQFNIDLGAKLSSSKNNRYQLENRYHFGTHVSLILNVGGNRWHSRLPTRYRSYSQGISSSIINHYSTDYINFKLGLQRELWSNEELKIFAGAMGGINIYTANEYEVYSQLTFEYISPDEEPILYYDYPRSIRKMHHIESQHYRQYFGELFTSLDYAPIYEFPLVFTVGIHGRVNYMYQMPASIINPYTFEIEINCGVRYILKDS